ncbi:MULTISPECIES: hypothetical protein [unclassified Pseudomonas]|uniref:hypothetical protein n=1 Tax=unclassified Pseudomonas TaxID=196821 RepID=UPI00289355E0|nr:MULTISPECIES: hypothetical protein [unclassified Pseudomonas]
MRRSKAAVKLILQKIGALPMQGEVLASTIAQEYSKPYAPEARESYFAEAMYAAELLVKNRYVEALGAAAVKGTGIYYTDYLFTELTWLGHDELDRIDPTQTS